MKTVFHQANSRGHADHGWLNSYHTFSFANYYNPERIHFGALRVLNDDTVMAGRGFGRHPHDNMELFPFPFRAIWNIKTVWKPCRYTRRRCSSDECRNRDLHSEYNLNKDKKVKFFRYGFSLTGKM